MDGERAAGADPDPARPDELAACARGHAGWRVGGGLLLTAALTALALVLRLAQVRTTYDVFVDEVSYAAIGRSVEAGDGVVLNGGLFFLHPPMFFVEIAALFRATRSSAGPVETVLSARPLDAVAGSLGVALAVVVLLRAARPLAAAVGGLLLAMDPFLIRFDSRLLLEAPAMAPATAGLLVLTAAPAANRRAIGWGLVAGSLFAVSAITKELYIFVGVLPALALVLVTRGPARTMHATAVVSTVVGYAVYLSTVVAGGNGGTWWSEKTVGIQRVIGTEQQTGFNRPGAPSLTSRLAANVATTSVSYALIAAGVVAALLVLATAWRRRATAPVPTAAVAVATWCAGAAAFLGYEIVLGTLEEQMFYPLLVTSTVALCVGLSLLADRAPAGSRRRVGRGVLVALVVAAVVGDGVTWTRIQQTPDDAYARMLSWSDAHLPDGVVVSATEDTAQFLLRGVEIGQWATVPQLVANRVDYVLVSTSLVEQGYGLADPSFLRTLATRATAVHTESGRTAGQLRLYDVRRLVAGARRAATTPARPTVRVPAPSAAPSAPIPAPLPTAPTVPIFPEGQEAVPAPLPTAPTVPIFPEGQG